MTRNQFITSIMMACIAEGVSAQETAEQAQDNIVEELILSQTDLGLFSQIEEEQQSNTASDQTCWDSNFGAYDSDGAYFTCESYVTPWCTQNSGGSHDTDAFNSGAMCCVCGGGCDCDPNDPNCDCAHPCPDGGCDKLNEAKFTVHSDAVTKNQAEQICRAKNGELATIHSIAEDDAVKSILESDFESYWIGLSDEASEGTFVWGDGSKLYYSGFKEGELNGDDTEECVQIRKGQDQGWTNSACDNTAPFVCQYSGFQVGPRYVLFNEIMHWVQAQDHCESQGMHLATIESSDDQEEFMKLFETQKSSRVTVWIGLNDEREEGKYEWASGSTASYTNWWWRAPNNGGGHEDEHCVEAWSEGQYAGLWNDTMCWLKRPFVCSRH